MGSVAATVFSISGGFHVNSRPTNRARMLVRLVSPFFVRTHLVETNSLPLASDSSTFSCTGNVCRNSTSVLFASLTCSASKGAPVNSSKNLSTIFSSHVCSSCPVVPGSNALMLSNLSYSNCCFKPLSTAVTASVPLSLVLCSLQRFPVCATFGNSSAMHRKVVNQTISLRTYTSSQFNDEICLNSFWINSHVPHFFIRQQDMDPFIAPSLTP